MNRWCWRFCVEPKTTTHKSTVVSVKQTFLGQLSTHCNILSIFAVILLFSFLTVTLGDCAIENNSSVCTLWLNFYFQSILIGFTTVCDISKSIVWWMIVAILTNIDENLARKQQKVQIDVFNGPPAIFLLNTCNNHTVSYFVSQYIFLSTFALKWPLPVCDIHRIHGEATNALRYWWHNWAQDFRI